MELTGKLAIITGAASGMGEATARLFAEKGAKVALLDKDHNKASIIAKELDGLAFDCDVTQDNQIEHAIKTACEQMGPARICVNCAGIAPAERIIKRDGMMALELFRSVIEINLIGSFNVMRHVAKHMIGADLIDEERGIIIHTASIAAFEGQIGQAAYSASKGGIVAMILPAAREFAQFGVRVNCIAPGVVATPMMLNMPQKVQDSLIANIPFPKRLAKPAEFAQLAKQMVENPMLNGTVIRLDGALRMG